MDACRDEQPLVTTATIVAAACTYYCHFMEDMVAVQEHHYAYLTFTVHSVEHLKAFNLEDSLDLCILEALA